MAEQTHPEVWTAPTREFAFPIESGHVLAFARSIGADEASTVVPPTFSVVADHFDPSFPRRPPLGQGWSDRVPASHLHVEQSFTYSRPLRIGETLTARRGQGRVWARRGRTAGNLRFVEDRIELYDADGDRVVIVSWVDVEAEQSHATLTNRQATDAAAAETVPQSGSAPVPDGLTLVKQITRTQIVMYVGASGDFHPLHHDDDLAQRNGYPSVFVPGMLTMALTGKAVTASLDPERLRSFGGRFRAQVWPGATLIASVELDTVDGVHRLGVTTRNEAGAVVFEGSATAVGT